MGNVFGDLLEKSVETTKLSEQQQDAVDAPLPTVVLAAAGTGKTTTMIQRIIKAKKEGIELSNMFVATFSKYAAQDMTNRLILELENAPEFIGTFHRNSIHLYKKFNQLITLHGHSDVKRINYATTPDIEKLIENLLEEYKDDIKDYGLTLRQVKIAIKNTIDYLKGVGIYPINYHGYEAPSNIPKEYMAKFHQKMESVGNVLKEKEVPVEKFFWEIFTNFQQKLKDANILDFNDIIALPVFAMRDGEVLKQVATKFKIVVIDEFQDCSKMQFELVEQLSNNYESAYLVGDEDQLLYEWRDADLDTVMSFYNNNFNVKFLEGNYRSQKPIVDLAVSIITQNKNRSAKVMKPMREVADPNSVLFIQPYDNKFEAYMVAKMIKKLILDDVKPNEIAIIFSSRYYRNRIEESLRAEEIDYNFVKGFSFFEYMEVKKVLNYLSLALDYTNDIAFKDIINYPKRQNGSILLSNLEKDAANEKNSLFMTLKDHKKMPNQNNNTAFIDLIKQLKTLMTKDKLPAKQLINLIIEKLAINDELVKEYGEREAEDRISRLNQLALMLEEKVDEYYDYESAVSSLWEEIFNTPKENIENKVQIMTAHASKGLEFEHVFIIGAINGNFPSFKADSNIESGRRIFYVATTRAKEQLIISSPRFIDREGTLLETMPTMFLNGLEEFYETISMNNTDMFKKYQKNVTLRVPSNKKYESAIPEGFND